MNKRIEPSPAQIPADERIPLAQQYESTAERYSFHDRCKAAGGNPTETPPAEEPAPILVEEPRSFGAPWPLLMHTLLPDGDSAADR